jgi:hypothetical protein
LNRAQRTFLAIGMLGMVAMLVWVPYSAVYKGTPGHLWTNAGYDSIFTPPDVEVCRVAIENYSGVDFGYGFQEERCEIRLDVRRLTLTAAAVALATGALVIVLGLLAPRGSSSLPLRRTVDSQPEPAPASPSSDIARALLARNPRLPIRDGDLSEKNPLVITARTNYVAAEYEVMEALHSGWDSIEFELKDQGLVKRGNKRIDELTYRYRKPGQSQWGHEKTYHFDVTIGMEELRREIEHRWWQVWK